MFLFRVAKLLLFGDMTKDFGKDLQIYNGLKISDIIVSVVKNFTMSAVRMGIVVVEDKKTPALWG